MVQQDFVSHLLQDCVVVSQKLLQDWLAEDCVNLARPALSETKPRSISPPTVPDDDTHPELDDSIMCEHRMLDPLKAKRFKRVKRVYLSLWTSVIPARLKKTT